MSVQIPSSVPATFHVTSTLPVLTDSLRSGFTDELKRQRSDTALSSQNKSEETGDQQRDYASAPENDSSSRFISNAFERTRFFLERYHATARELRREENINAYVDNSSQPSETSKYLGVIAMEGLEQRDEAALPSLGSADEGGLAPLLQENRYTMQETIRAIENYNLLAREAIEAKNHATYLQNSMAALDLRQYRSA